MKAVVCALFFFTLLQCFLAERVEETGEGKEEIGYKKCEKDLGYCLKRWYCKQWPVKAMWCKCGKELIECCDVHFSNCLSEDYNSMVVYNRCSKRYMACNKLAQAHEE